MGDTKIEWTSKTWNPIRGCSVVSEGCRNCYAMAVAARFSGDDPKTGKPLAYKGLAYRNGGGAHWTGKVKFIKEHLEDPLKWRKPQMIFVNSMSDLFHESVSDKDIEAIFGVMASASHHQFQVLTKRPQRMLEWVRSHTHVSCVAEMVVRGLPKGSRDGRRSRLENVPRGWPWPLPNVWLGVSCEDQKTADERIPLLLQTPATVRWISAEPLLEPVSLEHINFRDRIHSDVHDVLFPESQPRYPGDGSALPALPSNSIDWVVAGGESGPGARPMHPDWARSLRDQCVAAHVPFFFKQWGEWSPYRRDLTRVGNPAATRAGYLPAQRQMEGLALPMLRAGKKAAGRLLDGREWNEYPNTKENHAT